jgi:hypothetical protein
MAKQIGDIIIVGTIDDITFYEMDGKGYARKKSSLAGKKVKKDPRFKCTMQSAHRLGRGSQLASKLYRSLPRQEQVYALFKELKRIAVLGIKEGKGEADVQVLLQQRVEKRQEGKKNESVIAQPEVSSKGGQVKKTPRLFRVYGGRVKEVRRQRPKRKAATAAGLPLRDRPAAPSAKGIKHKKRFVFDIVGLTLQQSLC